MKLDVIVIGAGVVGTAIARVIAREGGRVAVFDRDEPCRHASWAAAGMLAPQMEAEAPGEFVSLLLHARSLFPALARELQREAGIDIGYRTEGALLLALTRSDEEHLARVFSWQEEAGLPVEWLDSAALRAREPSLSTRIRSGLYFSGDHQVDNRLLCRALWASAASMGVHFEIGSAVGEVQLGAGPGIQLHDGRRFTADRIVLAAGAWSATLTGLPRPLPVEPIHGQLISIAAPPPGPQHLLVSPRSYLVPRRDGRVIAGATMERTGFRTRVTPGGMHHVLSGALELMPALADRPIESSWSGLRPSTPDHLPILGPDPQDSALLYATGHFRNGILLAPLTGEAIGALSLGLEPAFDLEAFGIERFD